MPKILVIIIAAFLLIAGGVAGVLQHFEMGPFAPDEEIVETPGAKKRPTAKKDKKPPRFLAMEPLVVPIIQGDRIAAKLQMSLNLETDRKRSRKLRKLLPKLKDAMFRDLHGYFPRFLARKEATDLNMLKERLLIIGERAIGKGLMDRVLLQEYMLDRAGARAPPPSSR
ncbi:MAG: hypothetical protein QGF09_11400 [Rhodospirillales bacterium]|nr:hypothetical protein [Rhodospirillales bacterium]